jgi:Transcription factor S-II (TFIIS), central domain
MYRNHPDDYSKFARERVLLLKNKLNRQLKSFLLEGSLSIEDFVTKDASELESEESKKRLEEGHQWKMKAYTWINQTAKRLLPKER